MHDFETRCREAGLRVTPQRSEIFREMARSDAHPGAETLHASLKKRMPGISLDTVYRTLTTLERHGIITRVQVASSHSRFDARVEPHHHFVCTECGTIRDFASPKLDAYRVPEAVRKWGRIRQCRMEVRGVCLACTEEEK